MKSFNAFWFVLLLSFTCYSAEPSQQTNSHKLSPPKRSNQSSQVNTIRANCGPIVLQEVFKKHGIKTNLGDLVKESNTKLGLTSLYDMKQTVLKKGLYAEGIETDFKTLQDLLKDHDVICHFSKNNHYILLRSIDDKKVEFFDPSWVEKTHGIHTVWRTVFEKEWKGICLIISDKPLKLNSRTTP